MASAKSRHRRRRARGVPRIRKGQGTWPLTREEFTRRFNERFYDPAFESVKPEIDRILGVAADGYFNYRKSPRRRKAGAGFAVPGFELPVEWLQTRAKILEAAHRQRNRRSRSRILLICAASRNDKTCPGEMSKTYRLVTTARKTFEARRFDVDLLDLSELASEYGRVILPCKACVSTAMPLCHWPCSHEALDADAALFEEVRNAARSLMNAVTMIRKGRREPDDGLRAPRPK